MAFEPKDNTGSLFRNDRREKETHANARGSAMIDGVEYYVDAWTNKDRNGNPYQSLKFKRKTGADGRGEAKQPYDGGGTPAAGWSNKPADNQGGYDDLDDQIPFASRDVNW